MPSPPAALRFFDARCWLTREFTWSESNKASEASNPQLARQVQRSLGAARIGICTREVPLAVSRLLRMIWPLPRGGEHQDGAHDRWDREQGNHHRGHERVL